MGLGAYALAGAVEGLGMSLVKLGEDKKKEAERKRQEERDDKLRTEDRSYREQWRDEGRQYEQGQRAANARADTNVYQSLFGTESGGNFGADNGLGYTGRSQFGQARLDDWSRVNGAPRVTPADLKGNEKLQKDIEKWHFSDINEFIDKNGLDKYEGQKIGGVTITRSGIIAMSHLGGAGGAKKFLESGGKYNPEDAFGTSLSDYAAQHGGLSTDMAGVWDAMSDPNVTPSVRNAAATEVGRRRGLGADDKERKTAKDADGFLRYVDTGERVFPDATGKADSKKSLSSTIKTQMKDWFEENAIEQDLRDAFTLEVQRLVGTGMTEDEAWIEARRTANKSEDVVSTEERFILPDRETVTPGTYDGTFGKPRGLGAPEDPTMPSDPDNGLPKVGQVVDGYRFMGGDPSDEKNWKKV